MENLEVIANYNAVENILNLKINKKYKYTKLKYQSK